MHDLEESAGRVARGAESAAAAGAKGRPDFVALHLARARVTPHRSPTQAVVLS